MKKKFILAMAISIILNSSSIFSFADNLLGDQADPTTADRTIIIGPDTQYVNITHYETIKFVVGNKVFAWHFDEPTIMSEIDLNQIAPLGMLNHVVKVYIARDVSEDGGG